jgi:valyl-tRNA synthetase
MVEHGVKRRSLLALAQWPELDGLADAAADEEIGWVVQLVSEIRSLRTEMSIPWTQSMPLVLTGSEKGLKARVDRHEDTIVRLAKLEGITIAKAVPKASAVFVVGETTAALPLAGIIDMGAEKARLEKEIAAATSDLAKMDAKLANPAFVEKAKPEAVEETRERKAELEAGIRKWSAAVARLD